MQDISETGTLPFSVLLMTKEQYHQYKSSSPDNVAHWIYAAHKVSTLKSQRFDYVPALQLTGNFADDVAAAVALDEPWIYVSVEQEDWYGQLKVTPIRVSRGAIAADVIAHKGINSGDNNPLEIFGSIVDTNGTRRIVAGEEKVPSGVVLQLLPGVVTDGKRLIDKAATLRAKVMIKSLQFSTNEQLEKQNIGRKALMVLGINPTEQVMNKFLGPLAFDYDLKNERELYLAIAYTYLNVNTIWTRAIKQGKALLETLPDRQKFWLHGTLGTFDEPLGSLDHLYLNVGIFKISAEEVKERFTGGVLNVKQDVDEKGRVRLVVTGRDRPGLLQDLTGLLQNVNMDINSSSDETGKAKITLILGEATQEVLDPIKKTMAKIPEINLPVLASRFNKTMRKMRELFGLTSSEATIMITAPNQAGMLNHLLRRITDLNPQLNIRSISTKSDGSASSITFKFQKLAEMTEEEVTVLTGFLKTVVSEEGIDSTPTGARLAGVIDSDEGSSLKDLYGSVTQPWIRFDDLKKNETIRKILNAIYWARHDDVSLTDNLPIQFILPSQVKDEPSLINAIVLYKKDAQSGQIYAEFFNPEKGKSASKENYVGFIPISDTRPTEKDLGVVIKKPTEGLLVGVEITNPEEANFIETLAKLGRDIRWAQRVLSGTLIPKNTVFVLSQIVDLQGIEHNIYQKKELQAMLAGHKAIKTLFQKIGVEVFFEVKNSNGQIDSTLSSAVDREALKSTGRNVVSINIGVATETALEAAEYEEAIFVSLPEINSKQGGPIPVINHFYVDAMAILTSAAALTIKIPDEATLRYLSGLYGSKFNAAKADPAEVKKLFESFKTSPTTGSLNFYQKWQVEAERFNISYAMQLAEFIQRYVEAAA